MYICVCENECGRFECSLLYNYVRLSVGNFVRVSVGNFVRLSVGNFVRLSVG